MKTLRSRSTFFFLFLLSHLSFKDAWSFQIQISTTTRSPTANGSAESKGELNPMDVIVDRRTAIIISFSAWMTAYSTASLPAMAYTPDSDKLRESLYLISRVQEATVQQERFVSRATNQEALREKMKLTLKLVEKNYRLLDQINYASAFVEPKDELVNASEAGYEAVDSLQGAIDFVRNDLQTGPLTDSQRSFLMTSMQSCRENLFVFLKYMPQEKLEYARLRVEDENVKNREEFDGDKDAGVYNPVVLPWKEKK